MTPGMHSLPICRTRRRRQLNYRVRHNISNTLGPGRRLRKRVSTVRFCVAHNQADWFREPKISAVEVFVFILVLGDDLKPISLAV